MSTPQSPIQIFQLLDNSNCGQCGETTCMAFAAAVFRGQRSLAECPRVDPSLIPSTEEEEKPIDPVEASEREMAQRMQELQRGVESLDLAAAAERLGGSYDGKRLHLDVLGMDIAVDQEGGLHTAIHTNYWVAVPVLDYVLKHTAIHTNYWVAVPVLDYVLNASGARPNGQWKPLRELSQGISWQGLFGQRCEKPLKQVADTCPDLFRDLLEMFHGTRPENGAEADIAAVLYVLPLVPVLIAYWYPDEGLDSHLSVLFDANAERNLSMGSIFALGTGLGRMLEKLAGTHCPEYRG